MKRTKKEINENKLTFLSFCILQSLKISSAISFYKTQFERFISLKKSVNILREIYIRKLQLKYAILKRSFQNN